ncbi:MAG: FAD binding domain-containing protein [Brevefilum sp.]
MINTYFRPKSLEEAITLLTDSTKELKPLGGGTRISRKQAGEFGVVDLQDTGLGQITKRGQRIVAGAAVRLDELLEHPDVHQEIKRAIRIDVSENLRNMATLGGWLVSSDGRSILSTILLALDTTLTWEPNQERVRMGNWLPLREDENPGILLTELEWWLRPHLVFEYVARSPKDRPILVVAAAQWGSGRTRIALGGYGDSAIIAMDGPEDRGVDVASRDAYYDADDQWATALYRREVASRLALRCLDRIDVIKESEA